ncbi:MAG: hypothetical protein IAF38_02925 [Bacteroidia bacterium]|nr:hypothetical protein [Bacteroidia bacterium]
MKRLASIFFVFFVFQNAAHSQTENKTSLIIADSNFTVLQTDSTQFLPGYLAFSKSRQLSAGEIQETFILTKKCVENYNSLLPEFSKTFFNKGKKTYTDSTIISFGLLDGKPIDLSKYKLQLVPFINKAGETEVWVNCFCGAFDFDWRKSIFRASDGGKCFFSLSINLNRKLYDNMNVNGI